MKKILIALATTLSLAAATTTFAANTGTNDYYISSGDQIASKAFVVPATNITVLNYSDEFIYLASPVNYQIPSGNSRTISRNAYYDSTHIVLQDWNYTTFYDRFVCRRAIITVDGRPGYYRISVDGRYC